MKKNEKFYVIATDEKKHKFFIECITDDDTEITIRAEKLTQEKGIPIGIVNLSTQKYTYEGVINKLRKENYEEAEFSIIEHAEGMPSIINKNQ